MSEMARTEAIEVLKDIVSKPMLYSNHIIGACRVALASLETDEAYQLEFERTTTPQEPRWIPISERLPQEAFGCLVTVIDTDVHTQEEFENILPYFVGYDGESETWNDADGESIPFEVIAWMPLPQPYREVEE